MIIKLKIDKQERINPFEVFYILWRISRVKYERTLSLSEFTVFLSVKEKSLKSALRKLSNIKLKRVMFCY